MTINKTLQAALAAAALLFAVGSSPTRASQASCIMPTTGTVSGLTLVNDINACNQSILSIFSGATAPALPAVGMLWLNTTTNFVQQYDGSAWINLWYVDATNHLITVPIGGGVPSASVNIVSGVADLGSIPQVSLGINGTASITSFGSSAVPGTMKIAGFGGVATLVNSANMILPGGQDIIVDVGDNIFAFYLGTGRWKVEVYSSINRSPRVAPAAIVGNPSPSGRAIPFDMTPGTISQKVTPVGADKLPIWDSASSNQIKWVNASSLAALAGVTSIDGVAGPFTTGNGIGSPGSVIGLTGARRTLPTTTVLTASSGTYTTPANALWLEVKIVAPGGGGGGGNNASLSSAGGNTCWALSGAACASPLYAAGGGGGSGAPTVGAGGTAAGGNVSNTVGNSGSPGTPATTAANGVGGSGGSSCLGGGAPGAVGTGASASSNSGAGGGGGGSTNATISGAGAAGGASGGCVLAIISGPAASYTYAIGPGGAGASGATIASSVGGTGGTGGSGIIIVIEHYGT